MLVLVTKDVYFGLEDKRGKELFRVCYPLLDNFEKLFNEMSRNFHAGSWTINGLKNIGDRFHEHWTVFENTDFSRSLFLSIEGKKYLHFEDLFNYNKELCEKAYCKLSNIKTLLQIESNLK